MTKERIEELREWLQRERDYPGMHLAQSARVFQNGVCADLLALSSDYEAALPLLEAVKEATIVSDWTGIHYADSSIDTILRAASAYKERSQPHERD